MRRLAIALAMLAISPIAAKADELSDMKAALSAAMGSIHALQERVRVLEQEKGTTASIRPARKPRAAAPIVVRPIPPPLIEAAPVVAPDLKPVAAVPEAETARLEIHGSVQLDAIYDIKKVNPNWGDLAALTDPGELPAGWNRSGLRQKRRYELQRPGE